MIDGEFPRFQGVSVFELEDGFYGFFDGGVGMEDVEVFANRKNYSIGAGDFEVRLGTIFVKLCEVMVVFVGCIVDFDVFKHLGEFRFSEFVFIHGISLRQ
jgi:hypothetical protein